MKVLFNDLFLSAAWDHLKAVSRSASLLKTDSPEEGLGYSSEGREGGESDQSGDDTTNEDLENETPEAELATTICAQCAPAVQRLLANVERRVLQQLQEIPDG